MNPKTKITATAIALTITIMFWALDLLVPALSAAPPEQKLAAMLVSILASAGLYQSLTTGFAWILLTVPWLKQYLFAEYFLEGTWVGYYQEADHFCYLVETFEQGLEDIMIRGSSYDQNLARRAQWTSDSVTFDPDKGVLHYSYTCHILPDKTVDQGIAFFALVRTRTGKPATHLFGYSTDVKDGTRSASWELKIANHGLRPEDALQNAIQMKRDLDEKRKVA